MPALKPLRFAFAFCATVALMLAGGPAFAHAKLLSEAPPAKDASAPAATTPATPVTELRLSFSEGLNAAFSKVKVTDANGAAIDATAALDPNDGKVLVVTFTQALPKGEYTVSWTAVAADSHKTQGDYKLTVAQ
jgi:methionine-rich copper-binding protein CopC